MWLLFELCDLTAAGTSISIVTQYDIARVQVIIVASCCLVAVVGRCHLYNVARLQAIEAHTGVKMQELKLKDDDVLSLLKDVGAAKRKVAVAVCANVSASLPRYRRRL